MPASTVRSLVAAGLLLGRRDGPGHPDYSLADVVRVKLVEVLRANFGMDGPRSIFAVNSVFDELSRTVVGHFEGQSAFPASLCLIEGFAATNGYKPCIIAPDRAALLSFIEAYGLQHDRGCIVVPLGGVMSGAILGLSRVLQGDWEVRD